MTGGLASVAGGGKFANGAITAAFQYLFNDSQHQRRLYAVVHLDAPDDNIGHAFAVFEDGDGTRSAFGFWPAHPLNLLEQGLFVAGRNFDGVVRDESSTGYLRAFDEFLRTGRDPLDGSFAYRAFDVSTEQYASARSVVDSWAEPYSIRCMCGTFVQQVMGAAGQTIGTSDPESVQPRYLFRAMGGSFP